MQIKLKNKQCESYIKSEKEEEADRLRLSQVFDNVLSNAIKFAKEGNITIAIQRNEEEYCGGRDHTNNNDDQVIVSIKDTGFLHKK